MAFPEARRLSGGTPDGFDLVEQGVLEAGTFEPLGTGRSNGFLQLVAADHRI